MPRGGYQKPSSPAPVSGPGQLSRRTDGGPAQKLRELPDAQYGEAATFRELQQAAPLAQAPGPDAADAAPSGPGVTLAGLGDPTAMPDEPITAGPQFLPDPNMDARQRLAAVYSLYPSEDLREILEYLDGGL